MRIEKFDYNSLDDLAANTYVVSDANRKCVIIDPSSDNDSVFNYLKKNELTPVAVLLTHGHFDHIRGVNRLLKEYEIDVYIHELDQIMLTDPYMNCSFKVNVTVDKTPVLISDNEELKLLSEDTFKVIHTPFHTKGSVCYYLKDNHVLFSGDTLFKMSIGRDDLPNASPKETAKSLSKLLLLPEETKIYPGHGPNTVLKTEENFNTFLQNHNLV